MPTDAFKIAYSGQARSMRLTLSDATQVCDNLASFLTDAGWTVTKNLYAKCYTLWPWDFPYMKGPDPPPGYVKTDLGDCSKKWTVKFYQYKFVVYDSRYRNAPVGTDVVPVVMGANPAQTASILVGKLNDYIPDWSFSYTYGPARVQPAETDYDGYRDFGSDTSRGYIDAIARNPGPEWNDTTFHGDWIGSWSYGYEARGGGYTAVTAENPETGSTLTFKFWEERNNSFYVGDNHKFKAICTFNGDDSVEGRLAFLWNIGTYVGAGAQGDGVLDMYACPYQLIWVEAGGWETDYDNSDATREHYAGIISVPYVEPGHGVTSCGFGTRKTVRKLAYDPYNTWSGINGAWRRVRDFGANFAPVSMMRANHGVPIVSRSKYPIVLKPYLALTEAQAGYRHKIIGMLWDTVGVSSAGFGLRAKQNFDGHLFRVLGRANPQNLQASATLWIAAN